MKNRLLQPSAVSGPIWNENTENDQIWQELGRNLNQKKFIYHGRDPQRTFEVLIKSRRQLYFFFKY